jgi:lysophospholipase L1-like esterase
VFIEGLASYGLIIRDVMRTGARAEPRYTKYDPELGWVSEPNVYMPDMYGPGIYLRTNAQAFRNDRDIQATVAKGKARVVCSGDSFTFGYGVENAHSWCELLSLLEPRLETVNMGQPGYGVDQAYLWYKRDAATIEHHVQLLAFVTHDFYRMQSDSFWGYPKPVLEVEDGTLVVKNVPVPRRTYHFPWTGAYIWLRANVGNLLRLRTVELLNNVVQKIRVATAKPYQLTEGERDEKTREVLRKLFEDLKRINKQRSSTLVLVYLPTLSELEKGPRAWTAFLEQESRTLGIPFINLFSEFRSLPNYEQARLFIAKGELPYAASEGHFNAAGNEFVARAIHDKLMNYPAIFSNLSARWTPE